MGVSEQAKRRGALVLGLVASLVLLLGFVRASGAVGDRQPEPVGPTPERPVIDESREYADLLNNRELMTAEPSIQRYVDAHTIPNDLALPANLNPSTKTVAPTEVPPYGTATFTITIENSGDTDAPTTMTDELPADLTYLDHECNAILTEECSVDGDTVTWKGIAIPNQMVTVTISAQVAQDAEPGKIVNTATIVSDGKTIERSAELTVTEAVASPFQFLPFTIYGIQPEPQAVVLTAGVPNSENKWTMSWTEGLGSTGYELQESLSPTFEGAYPYIVGPQTSFEIVQLPSFNNVFYYRVRSLIGGQPGPWSNIVSVVGGYYDDFSNELSGWQMRRETFPPFEGDEVRSYYEIGPNKSWYVMYIDDRYDWGLAAPNAPAPRVPYYIQFDAKNGDTRTPTVSFGPVWGGDWPSTNGCPSDTSTDAGIRRHQDCFNHFYLSNNIFFGDLKLLFERVDELVWCPTCGGSPLKRRGDIRENDVEGFRGIDPEGWNTYRVEVRADGMKLYAGRIGQELRFQYEYNDTRWIGDPYFGIFASTDEWSDSIWLFDYFEVMPLDN